MTKSVPNTNEYYETPEGDIIFGNRFKGNPSLVKQESFILTMTENGEELIGL